MHHLHQHVTGRRAEAIAAPPTPSVPDETARWRLVKRRLLHDADEFLLVYLSILILVELVDHPAQLVVSELLAEVPSDSLQVPERDLPPLLLVEKLKGLAHLVHRIL